MLINFKIRIRLFSYRIELVHVHLIMKHLDSSQTYQKSPGYYYLKSQRRSFYN